MENIELREGDDFIKLSQALKKAGLVENGAEAKTRIRLGEVKVNGEIDDRPGRKLVSGDVIVFENGQYKIV